MPKKTPSKCTHVRLIRTLVLFLVLLPAVSVSLAAGTVYYIDAAAGSDSGDGLSPETAWRTINKINISWEQIEPGDDILLKKGVVFTDASLNIRKGGSAGDPLIIGAYGSGALPIIDCGPQQIHSGIYCSTENLAHIVIQDIEIRNSRWGSAVSFGAKGVNNITIRRMDIHDCPGYNGILLVYVDTYMVEACRLYNCGNCGIAVVGSEAPTVRNGIIRNNVVWDVIDNDGISLHLGGSGEPVGPNHQILNNVCYDCAEQGLDITSGENLILRGNETFRNGDSSILIGFVDGLWIDRHYSHDEPRMGIIIGGAADVTMSNSIIYNAGNYSLTLTPDTGLVGFSGFNNTIVFGPDSYGSLVNINEKAVNIVFRNNIFASLQWSDPHRYLRFLGGATPANTNSFFSHNLWWRPDGGAADNRLWYDEAHDLMDFNQWRALPDIGEGSLFADPRFFNPAAGDFHLSASSPCIDAGVDVGLYYDHDGNLSPQGFPPDIGAYVYGAFGTSGNIPVSGDWDNSGTVNYGIYRDGKFYLDTDWDSYADIARAFGVLGDFPVSGDWDGDGIANYGIYRTGRFYLDVNFDGQADIVKSYGQPGDYPITGDWDGDGTVNYGIYREGKFYLDSNWDGLADIIVPYGRMGDIPVVGDWDGDGTFNYGVFREGRFLLDTNGDSIADMVKFYGSSGDIPVTGDWTGDGRTNYGIYRPGNCRFYLDTNWDSIGDIVKAYGSGK